MMSPILTFSILTLSEVILSILLESFAFEISDMPIRWNTASVEYPSTVTGDKTQLPIKLKQLV